MVMALTAHFHSELHQMNVKIAYLNDELQEDIFTRQPTRFVERGEGEYGLQPRVQGLKFIRLC